MAETPVTSLDDAAFEKLVEEGFEQLPEWVQKKISNVAVLIEADPSPEDRRLQGLADNETLLGLYKGMPLTERGDLYGVGMTMPDTITIYREPILDAAEEETPQEASDEVYLNTVRRIVAETVWHEFAHHFGMDEHEVQLREKKRDGATGA
jgi:predicted Zn-dependent protease with MMP-like domain